MKNLNFDFETIDFQAMGEWPALIKVGILLMVFSIACYIGYVIKLEEDWDLLQTKKNQSKTLADEIEAASNQIKHYATFKEEADKIGLKLESLKNQLPLVQEEAKLLAALSEQALQCRLRIQTIKPQPEMNKENYLEYPMVITLTGGYHDLGEFIARLLTLSPIVSLQEYTLEQTKAETLEIQLLLKTYRLIEAQNSNLADPFGTNEKTETVGTIENQGKLEEFGMLDALGMQEKLEGGIESESIADKSTRQVSSVDKRPRQGSSYSAKNLRSPFDKTTLSSMDKPAIEHQSQQEETTRSKELLELYPLDSLKMVGFIEREGVVFGLVRDYGGNIHRVKVGDYLGQNEGRIEAIEETGLEIKETLSSDSLPSEDRKIVLPLSCSLSLQKDS